MSAKFQIGYPYATSPNERKSVVLLERQDKPGFIYINAGDCICRPMDRDEGPRILDGVLNKGVTGNLKEFDEDKKSIVRDNKILAEGKSSQLAIVLAAHSFYDQEVESFPVLLFSAAISCYQGKMFKGAKIIPYAKKSSNLLKSLVVKYEAACKIGAVAIVIPKRDAHILAQELGESAHGIEQIKDLPKEKDKKPLIIGAKTGSLPRLAEIIGIDKHVFTFSKTIFFKYAGIIGLLLGIIFLLCYYFFYPKNEVHWNYIKSTDIWESEKYSFLRDLVSNSSPNYDNLNNLRLKNNYKKVQYFYLISSHYPKNELPKFLYVPENLDALISTIVFEEKNNLTRNVYSSPSIKRKLNLKLKNIKNIRVLILIYPFSDNSEKFISKFLQSNHGKKLKNINSLLTIKLINE